MHLCYLLLLHDIISLLFYITLLFYAILMFYVRMNKTNIVVGHLLGVLDRGILGLFYLFIYKWAKSLRLIKLG
ncbi:hypothetical protein HanXRQr2_Chr14g0647501 [Helianthus annuus]|uniref:Uncharacterized protein n=1 Tax=Helianthus annuus TaxID=4232 RepID=A0A251SLL2_HELAN|nr:hypothetical protein HanXRQr2_Chr14g0647501 [Helianthus annuus]